MLVSKSKNKKKLEMKEKQKKLGNECSFNKPPLPMIKEQKQQTVLITKSWNNPEKDAASSIFNLKQPIVIK